MTIANWCVLIACILPIATIGLAKGPAPAAERYDNNNPRQWMGKLTGWRARASAAQSNGFEALPLFIAGVILAQQAHADQGRVDTLAMAFIAIRLAYTAAYLSGLGLLRTLIWLSGLGVSIALLLQS